jgi:hypothetical protein
MNDWFKLYVTRDTTEANIIKGMLEENDIGVVMLNKQDSSFLNFGNIELYVPQNLKEEAKQLLNKSLNS